MKKINTLLCSLTIAALATMGCTNTNSNKSTKETSTETQISVVPTPYNDALRNPLMGLTRNEKCSGEWVTLAHQYIKWNEIESCEADGVDKIKEYCNKRWAGIETNNNKVIPRVYLHWSTDDQKYWPSDMQTDDYTSEQFQKRMVRLIKRLGECWDNDPRVAYVMVGIFGKWGEHHSPEPTIEMQKLAGETFAKAFPNKKVIVRHCWQEFKEFEFGEGWDSWAHYNQMWTHGNAIAECNKTTDRYKHTLIGGEVAYDWGKCDIQPGKTPNESLSLAKHRDFIINSIYWLHCSQIRWIAEYDTNDVAAVAGAAIVQKALGYRFVIDKADIAVDSHNLNLSLNVTNVGAAPFYYNWPVQVALVDASNHSKVVWAKNMDVDIRDWQPGRKYTEPEWTKVGNNAYNANPEWNSSIDTKDYGYSVAAECNKAEFKGDISKVAKGEYLLTISILDPAGNLPCVKFATANYLKGARHPLAKVIIGDKTNCSKLPSNFQFDDPKSDNSLHYKLN